MTRVARLLLILGAVSLAQPAWADNTTAATAYAFAIGGPAAEATVNPVGPVDRWYRVGSLVAGRSYCALTQGGVLFNTSDGANDTVLTVYQPDATTVIGTNDDNLGEPGAYLLSRACFFNPATGGGYVKVSAKGTSAFNVRMALVETTLFSNWFFLGGDYGAFTLIRNTTGNFTFVSYTVNWRDSAGTIVATTTGTLPANGSTVVNARSFPGAVAAVSGTVEIAHNGSPGAIVATTTVLSGTTGLSFDTIFQARPTW